MSDISSSSLTCEALRVRHPTPSTLPSPPPHNVKQETDRSSKSSSSSSSSSSPSTSYSTYWSEVVADSRDYYSRFLFLVCLPGLLWYAAGATNLGRWIENPNQLHVLSSASNVAHLSDNCSTVCNVNMTSSLPLDFIHSDNHSLPLNLDVPSSSSSSSSSSSAATSSSLAPNASSSSSLSSSSEVTVVGAETAYVMSVGAISNEYSALPRMLPRLLHSVAAPIWIAQIVVQKIIIRCYIHTRNPVYLRFHRMSGIVFVINTLIQTSIGMYVTYHQAHLSHQLFNLCLFGPWFLFACIQLYRTAKAKDMKKHRWWGNIFVRYSFQFPATQVLVGWLYSRWQVSSSPGVCYWIAILIMALLSFITFVPAVEEFLFPSPTLEDYEQSKQLFKKRRTD